MKFSRQKGISERGKLGRAGNENNAKSKNMYLDNTDPSPTEFSKLPLMVKTKSFNTF